MNPNVLIMLALGALLIFMMVSSRRKQKAHQEQIARGLVPGARIMTGAGIFGTVVSVDEETNQVTIESGPGTQLIIHRRSIGHIEANEPAAPAEQSSHQGPIQRDDADESPLKNSEPSITDAELDAHNEAKRAKGDDADSSDDTK
ncbi:MULTISPECIES: preprotein translocase subunit YajC [unclassified Brevibacterium]|uniref:preprotein translocase subunit YajC n=1 Tax=unclassified Brevibacterium TaxID=2614124 RepID=UPI0008A19D6A|nr:MULTISPECIES: preprotein translocase subunit YajC [unclassified Brevibacterium]OFL64057.1 hypothetical protein HMPREF2757_00940 [Brevibacterium sp. HMSC063G07]OFS27129.1 hypothetical protein HMPREF3162_02885 [Brevibacterium sp. HMSC07C04]